jgi:hypothetical protein
MNGPIWPDPATYTGLCIWGQDKVEKTIKDLNSKSNSMISLVGNLSEDADADLKEQVKQEEEKLQNVLDDLGDCKCQAQFLQWSSEQPPDLSSTCLSWFDRMIRKLCGKNDLRAL